MIDLHEIIRFHEIVNVETFLMEKRNIGGCWFKLNENENY